MRKKITKTTKGACSSPISIQWLDCLTGATLSKSNKCLFRDRLVTLLCLLFWSCESAASFPPGDVIFAQLAISPNDVIFCLRQEWLTYLYKKHWVRVKRHNTVRLNSAQWLLWIWSHLKLELSMNFCLTNGLQQLQQHVLMQKWWNNGEW